MEQQNETGTPETTPEDTELLFPYSIAVPHQKPAYIGREHWTEEEGRDLSTYYNLDTVGDVRQLPREIHQGLKIASLCEEILTESHAMPESATEEEAE